MPMSNRPNILLISTDHWSGALLGAAAHESIQTPTLDELARAGVRYPNCYAECPVCIPARRTLMTGTPPRTHGDRIFNETLPMPELPTLAQTLRDAGYQAYAVGKLHVYPQRDRIGFHDVVLDEEGRQIYGVIDDYELFLGEEGYAGQQYAHGMSNNEYSYRPWHLPEYTHATNWATREMAKVIRRRDPKRPGFWFLSYRHPHPPIVPLQPYLDLYNDPDFPIDLPMCGTWAEKRTELPFSLQAHMARGDTYTLSQTMAIRRAFYALCTHIDHQLRVVIGTLREEGLLDNTIICFTADHGDMLGNHNLWAKRLFYEPSANIPLILLGVADDPRVGHNQVDERLVGWQDVMPTLLDLAGVPIPASVEGISALGEERRDYFYGEIDEGPHATRMIHDGRFKLIYYASGNYRQLFDPQNDPLEVTDLAQDPVYAHTLARLEALLISELYGGDENWVQDGVLVGLPDRTFAPGPNRGLTSQRGIHWPPAPKTDMPQIQWFSEGEV